MTGLPDRFPRAFRDHDAFEPVASTRFESVTTPFEGVVALSPVDEARAAFEVTVRVPMLGEVVDGEVAPVVEDGWYETFELRLEDAAGVARGDHDVTPAVRTADGDAVVELRYEELNERRGVDDAEALINYVEGTYVEGIIPGYDYLPPVTELLSRAYHTSDSD